ncbi:uncharacterized protein LOC128395822 [Panonychus citri]|uniref:uncharacterized protein LOC128395822 n=1 Tax=Panonychus citri TaxID=50023 RepID=UPI002307908D|nr:uncharacterized protein LOC128395822 [Panonychus citri]
MLKLTELGHAVDSYGTYDAKASHDLGKHHNHQDHDNHRHHKIGHHGRYVAAASELKGSNGSPARHQRRFDDKGFPLDGEHGNGHPNGPVNANGFDQSFRSGDFGSGKNQQRGNNFHGRERESTGGKHNFSGKSGFDRDPFQSAFGESKFGESKFGEGKLAINSDRDGDGEYRRLASNYPRAEEGHKYSKSSLD